MPGSSGSSDGAGSTARFFEPSGVAVDGSGNIYIADTSNNTIRKMTPAGVVSTLAGLAGSSGSSNGTGNAARFYNPRGVAVDNSGNVYVADCLNNTIRKVTPAGVVTTLAGLAGSGGSSDGAGNAARFGWPYGVAVDGSGNVYVADKSNRNIRKVTPAGMVTTLAGSASYPAGSNDGTGSAARFSFPTGLAVDSSGNVYVADSGNNTIRKVTPTGVVTTLAGLAGSGGSSDGTGNAARFNQPSGVGVDGSGNLYVADQSNNTIRKVTPGGVVSTLAGLAGSSGSTDATGNAARFSAPAGVAVDSSGNVYVADWLSNTIRKVTAGEVVSTLAGLARFGGSSDGTGSDARFSDPTGVAVDVRGNICVADSSNNTIRMVTPAGVVSTLAGQAGSHGSDDGTGSARFSAPAGVAVDTSGNVYVADSSNHTIRMVTPAGVVTTLAGLATSPGSSDGTGSDARFNGPAGVAVDVSGNVYVADTGNSTIRKVTPGGVVTTLAGLAGISSGSIDGTGSDARFSYPTGVAVDASGNVYVADYNNSTIRMVTPAGVVSTLAGLAGSIGNSDGTGKSASFSGPMDVAVDDSGNIYVADTGNNTIRKVTPTGAVTTIGGTAGLNGWTDGIGVAASFSSPRGIAISNTGILFVADPVNNRIIMGVVVTTPIPVTASATSITGTAATLNGTVNASGFSTAVSFDYGLTTAYGSNVIGLPTTATGSSDTAESVVISGLSPGTTYHFRVKAASSQGTANGGDLTFTTAFTPGSWRQQWFGNTGNTGNAADSADPFYTGVPNLVVFALFGQNQNPAQMTAAQLPQPQIVGGNYVYSFTEPVGVSGIRYGVEYTSSLSFASWQPVTDAGSGTLHIFSVPIGSNPQMFMRLTLTNLGP